MGMVVCMNTESMQYFVELSKDLHITNTASRLFISQQTLSNHIVRLEKKLGIQLLYRKPKPMLTFAGELFLQYCQTTLLENNNLMDKLASIRQEQYGILRFGASHFRMNNSIHHIFKDIHGEFPLVSLELTEAASYRLESLVAKGALDFCLVLADEPNPELKAHHMFNDQIYVCVANELLRHYYTEEEIALLKRDMQRGLEVSSIAKLPYCMFNNRIGTQISRCFQEANIKPKVFISSTHIEISMNACIQGLAACFSTQMGLMEDRKTLPSDINVFQLLFHGDPVTQRLVLLHMRNRYLPSYAVRFMELLQNHFDRLRQVDFVHIGAASQADIADS